MHKLKNGFLSMCEQHPYHLVSESPWPFLTASILYSMVLRVVLFFDFSWVCPYGIIIDLCILGFMLSSWFYDVILESTFEGHHTLKVQSGMKIGMVLFIISETMFFVSFFGSFFYLATGLPYSMMPLNPLQLPLMNTIILVSSGISVTVAHMAIKHGLRASVMEGLFITIILGLIFTCIQFYEYRVAPFSMNDHAYGSLFYICTGFHGIHVVVGTLFLLVCFLRHMFYHFTSTQHVGLDCAVWYWHFVDVVWIFLYMVVYWGSYK